MKRNRRGSGDIFQDVSGLKPGRSVFNLSYEKKFTCDMGQLIPVMCEESVPGDTWLTRNEIVVRMGPSLAPILHQINIFVHYFFVPYRLLWPGDEVGPSWESFISGGPTGVDASTLPKWAPANTALGSLWDYLGFPIGVSGSANFRPMAFPMNAYNMVYNEYYRDQNLIAKVSLSNENILLRAWEKDYFTSSLPWTQRGTPPALPFSGSAVWASSIAPGSGSPDRANPDEAFLLVNKSPNDPRFYVDNLHTNAASWQAAVGQVDDTGSAGADARNNLINALNANTLTAATFGVNDLRLSFQVQKWLERNARAGVRYTEFLQAHFGVAPRDERMQRPEYLGGTKAPIIISEVLQTAATATTGGGNTPLGYMAGHGLGVHRGDGFRYTAQEFGIVIGIMSIMPRSGYSQGINRQWLRSTRYDFYHPEFAHLSEQPVFRGELFLDGVDADNQTVFGYQGRYDEMRYKPNQACALFARGQTMDYWHLSREFASAPSLNQTFIECNPNAGGMKRVFQVQDATNAFYVNFANVVKAIRPLPFEPSPGLIDHF